MTSRRRTYPSREQPYKQYRHDLHNSTLAQIGPSIVGGGCTDFVHPGTNSCTANVLMAISARTIQSFACSGTATGPTLRHADTQHLLPQSQGRGTIGSSSSTKSVGLSLVISTHHASRTTYRRVLALLGRHTHTPLCTRMDPATTRRPPRPPQQAQILRVVVARCRTRARL